MTKPLHESQECWLSPRTMTKSCGTSCATKCIPRVIRTFSPWPVNGPHSMTGGSWRALPHAATEDRGSPGPFCTDGCFATTGRRFDSGSLRSGVQNRGPPATEVPRTISHLELISTPHRLTRLLSSGECSVWTTNTPRPPPPELIANSENYKINLAEPL